MDNILCHVVLTIGDVDLGTENFVCAISIRHGNVGLTPKPVEPGSGTRLPLTGTKDRVSGSDAPTPSLTTATLSTTLFAAQPSGGEESDADGSDSDTDEDLDIEDAADADDVIARLVPRGAHGQQTTGEGQTRAAASAFV